MGTRKRTGWRRVINGVNISAFFVVLFIGVPLYWLIISSFKTPADLGTARRSTGRTRGAAPTTPRPSSSTTSARTSSTR